MLTTFKCFSVNSNKEVKNENITKDQLLNETQLRKRDLRFLSISQPNNIFVREKAIVTNLMYIKAIILSNKAYFFNPNDKHIKPFVDKLKNKINNQDDDNKYFEFSILEIILDEICNKLTEKYNMLEQPISEILKRLLQSPTANQIKNLLPFKDKLTKFKITVEEIYEVLDDILDKDDNMAEMYLTFLESSQNREPPTEIDDIEDLLGSYFIIIDDIKNKIEITDKDISETDDTVAMTLDLRRNNILIIELLATLFTLSLSICNLVAAIFGMNLTSHIETHDYAFYIVISSVVLCILLFCTIIYNYLKNKNYFKTFKND